MRVTHLGSYYANVNRVNQTLESFTESQQRMSSGRRLQRPSDDATGMDKALELRAGLRTREQELRNANDGEMWVNLADTKLQAGIQHLQRARELAVAGGSSLSADSRSAIAREVAALRSGMVEVANAQHQGRGLFSGFAQTDAVERLGGVWTYLGDDGQVRRRIDESEVVTVNVTADDAFGFTAGKDVFTVLDDFETALLADDTAGIENAIAEIDASMETMLGALTELGSAGSRIESAKQRIATDIGTLKGHLSSLEDVDLAEAVMELQMQETAYQSALAAFARSSQSSLIDFLR